ncbi:hypothetical protein DSO57_1003131 [Entomophthora muscae]|uniref:Uncharacterized protein n=1 Tax=Entomophthora muscae TaxID=34485 RepID=A0ACC2RNC9_9FUNG|nr:hypothetical protein DSO57_1003131 [Entomophthora muscae]
MIRDQVLPNAPNRRKLSIRMVPPTLALVEEPEQYPLKGPSPGAIHDTFIWDLDAWKKEQKLSPLPYHIAEPIPL